MIKLIKDNQCVAVDDVFVIFSKDDIATTEGYSTDFQLPFGNPFFPSAEYAIYSHSTGKRVECTAVLSDYTTVDCELECVSVGENMLTVTGYFYMLPKVFYKTFFDLESQKGDGTLSFEFATSGQTVVCHGGLVRGCYDNGYGTQQAYTNRRNWHLPVCPANAMMDYLERLTNTVIYSDLDKKLAIGNGRLVCSGDTLHRFGTEIVKCPPVLTMQRNETQRFIFKCVNSFTATVNVQFIIRDTSCTFRLIEQVGESYAPATDTVITTVRPPQTTATLTYRFVEGKFYNFVVDDGNGAIETITANCSDYTPSILTYPALNATNWYIYGGTNYIFNFAFNLGELTPAKLLNDLCVQQGMTLSYSGGIIRIVKGQPYEIDDVVESELEFSGDYKMYNTLIYNNNDSLKEYTKASDLLHPYKMGNHTVFLEVTNDSKIVEGNERDVDFGKNNTNAMYTYNADAFDGYAEDGDGNLVGLIKDIEDKKATTIQPERSYSIGYFHSNSDIAGYDGIYLPPSNEFTPWSNEKNVLNEVSTIVIATVKVSQFNPALSRCRWRDMNWLVIDVEYGDGLYELKLLQI